MDRKTLCLWIPHFRTTVEAQTQPSWSAQPLAIYARQANQRRLIEVSAAARRAGLRPGMAVKEAAQRCPHGIYVADDPPRYARAFEAVLDVLDRFSPVVEDAGVGLAFADAAGLGPLYGADAALGARVRRDVEAGTGSGGPCRTGDGTPGGGGCGSHGGGRSRRRRFQQRPGVSGRTTGRPAPVAGADDCSPARARHRHDRRVRRSAGQRRADALRDRGRAGTAVGARRGSATPEGSDATDRSARSDRLRVGGAQRRPPDVRAAGPGAAPGHAAGQRGG